MQLHALAQADVVAVLGVFAAVAVEDSVFVVESVVVGALFGGVEGCGEYAEGQLHEGGLEDALGAEEGDAVGVEEEAFEEEGAGEFVAVEFGLVGGYFCDAGDGDVGG